MGASDRLAFDILADEDRAWLRGLPGTAEPAPGVLAFHGSPDDDLCYLLETVDPAASDALRQATDQEVMERLGDLVDRFEVFACGHTHLQRTRRLANGSMLVNPGSVGWQAYEDDSPVPHRVEAGSPQARYTVIDGNAGGWGAEERCVDYDYDDAIKLAVRNGREDVANAIRTGRVV